MNECDSKLKDLKKLRHKAELSRDINSRLKEKFQSHLSWKKFGTVSLSTTLTLVIGLYYRELLSGEWVTIAVLALPIIVVMLETLDNTVFRWVDKINGHESAVQIWGSWIRKANFLDEEWLSKEDSVRDEELKKLQREYIDCMDRVPQIPNKYFLKSKVEYKVKRLKSEEIDGMDLKVLEKTRIWKKRHE